MTFFNQPTEPRVHIVNLDASSVSNRVLAIVEHSPDTCVRVLRGAKMTTEQRLLDEFAAAYQFPHYFGENWNALVDCMSDLSWMPAARYLMVIRNADVMLSQAPELFRAFVGTINAIARDWGETQPSARPWAPEPHAFHLVLQAEVGDGASALNKSLQHAGIEFAGPDTAY